MYVSVCVCVCVCVCVRRYVQGLSTHGVTVHRTVLGVQVHASQPGTQAFPLLAVFVTTMETKHVISTAAKKKICKGRAEQEAP